MAQYEIQHRYASSTSGRTFGPWNEGDVVDLDAADAAWVLHDSPGSLRALDVPEEQEPSDPESGQEESGDEDGSQGPSVAPSERSEPEAAPRPRRGRSKA